MIAIDVAGPSHRLRAVTVSSTFASPGAAGPNTSAAVVRNVGAGGEFVSLAGISKSYGGTVALESVDLRIRRASIHAILGENGAGKSTLIKVLTGVVRPDAGSVTIDGASFTVRSPATAAAAGIACVFQELSLVPDLSVADNIFLAHGTGRIGFIDRGRQRKSAEALLRELGSEVRPTDIVRSLTLSEAQLVEIAKALAKRPRLLILDEATSALGEQQVGRLFQILRRLRDEGVSILYITHRMHEVDTLCDTCSVFRNGRHVETFAQGTRSPNAVVELMLGRAVSQIYPAKPAPADGPPLLEVRDLSWDGRIDKVSFVVRPGEIYGIGGLEGHGQHETLLALFGVLRNVSGEIRFDGRPVTIGSPGKAKCRELGIALVPEDRKSEGLHLPLTIANNLTLSVLNRLTRFGVIDAGRQRRLVDELMKRLQIKASTPKAPVSSLSGGNQQKVVLAKWLACDPRLILLCDPTRGIDVGTKAEIYALLRRLAAEGAAIVLHTTDYDELIGLCDRVGIFYGGTILRELSGDALNERNILRASFALADDAPVAGGAH
jgi:ribose transport system ATP-binding protein